jgi:hypothetical protein
MSLFLSNNFRGMPSTRAKERRVHIRDQCKGDIPLTIRYLWKPVVTLDLAAMNEMEFIDVNAHTEQAGFSSKKREFPQHFECAFPLGRLWKCMR